MTRPIIRGGHRALGLLPLLVSLTCALSLVPGAAAEAEDVISPRTVNIETDRSAKVTSAAYNRAKEYLNKPAVPSRVELEPEDIAEEIAAYEEEAAAAKTETVATAAEDKADVAGSVKNFAAKVADIMVHDLAGEAEAASGTTTMLRETLAARAAKTAAKIRDAREFVKSKINEAKAKRLKSAPSHVEL